MPAYEYSCTSCDEREVRITAIDDHTVICDKCHQVMVRQMDLDTLLASYRGPAEQAELTT
jgi:putative FmdB family regulatory protein